MHSKITSFVVCTFLVLAGLPLAMPQAWAQAQPQTPPQTQANAAETPAATNALSQANPNETTLSNGVKMEILRAGDGPKPEPNAIVHIQYIGHLEDGTEFARSYSSRQPAIYKLSDVIGCWQTGIPEMQVGSKVKFTCPPGSANGKRPVDFIWGNTTLYFVIELIAIVG